MPKRKGRKLKKPKTVAGDGSVKTQNLPILQKLQHSDPAERAWALSGIGTLIANPGMTFSKIYLDTITN